MFGLDAFRVLESGMVTHINGEWFAEQLYVNQGQYYLDQLQTYINHVEHYKKKHPSFSPKDFEQIDSWCSLRIPPGGAECRRLFEESANSVLNLPKISDKQRHTLETKRVGCHTIMAADHTFSAAKLCRS